MRDTQDGWRLPHTHAQHIEWTLARDGQRLTCRVLQPTRGKYTLRIMSGNVRFLDVPCGSLQSVIVRSLEMLDTLRGRGWAPSCRR